MKNPVFSCIIPCKSKDDPLLKDCIYSIQMQDFPQDRVEILLMTEGDAEFARSEGYKIAKGEICVAIDSDNYLTYKSIFRDVKDTFDFSPDIIGYYSAFYYYYREDNSLNRYFALMGNNDPITYYLKKTDRKSYLWRDPKIKCDVVNFKNSIPTLGCNGFFIKKKVVINADLDHGYHIDICEDLRKQGFYKYIRDYRPYLWHRTSGGLIRFLRKRYDYAKDFYCNRNDRRWKMLNKPIDYWRLFLFVLATLTIIQPLFTSIRGFLKVRDWAWFYHPIICLGFLITYGALFIRWKTSVLLSLVSGGMKASKGV